jgi:mannitol/fructose-specific phosphotransferase system IIA component (Ntr-type)
MNKLLVPFSMIMLEGNETKEQVLQKIATFSFMNGFVHDEEQVVEELHAREEDGNTMIAESFALPHLENSNVKESNFILVRSQKGILWQETYQAKTIFVVLLKKNETKKIKQAVVSIMKCLAYDENLMFIGEKSKEEIEDFLARQLY